MATDEQTRPTTPEEDIRVLYKRVARLNDAVSALLNPQWGTQHGILPAGHPLRTTQSDAEERTRLNAVLDAAQARADREAVNRVRALAEGEYYGITGRAFLAALDGDSPAHPDAEEQGAPTDWQAVVRRRERELKTVGEARHRVEQERDAAYRERAQLLALLATHYPAVLAPAPDVDEPGWQILFLTTPTGQASWHIAPRDADLFGHVSRVTDDHSQAQWDGHTTGEKYERIAELTQLRTQPGPAAPVVGEQPHA